MTTLQVTELSRLSGGTVYPAAVSLEGHCQKCRTMITSPKQESTRGWARYSTGTARHTASIPPTGLQESSVMTTSSMSSEGCAAQAPIATNNWEWFPPPREMCFARPRAVWDYRATQFRGGVVAGSGFVGMHGYPLKLWAPATNWPSLVHSKFPFVLDFFFRCRCTVPSNNTVVANQPECQGTAQSDYRESYQERNQSLFIQSIYPTVFRRHVLNMAPNSSANE
ncbi:hypothetical protein B0H14DRAFT_2580003 [Mycena olivaceomarginata]|nr:hypothetical protein B0H14DRAFT_2580003 [Mycena olivaceomarginata]